ncbi:FCD domain-containing protein [Cetobacterium somerae]|uniref:FadR/GntR family transcriptional regulator n=1 Tax=Cetobacterium sp. NK01 TaxID=2993530 RepID=UPI002116E29C|nr:FCD domain-containing protein [Cetobacterium sp. NK01]MCQ8211041.1 FCD domain-containing protein [Cetobacterium sp. NK01]
MKNKNYNIILEYIKDKIEKNTLKPGGKIETERDLAEKLNLSRATVRETLKVLTAMGITTCIQGSGYYLKDDFTDSFFENFNLFFLLTGKKVIELIDFREGVEVKAFELALKNITREELEDIGRIIEKLKNVASEEESSILDAEFHRAIVEASHNIFFISLYNSSRSTLESFIKNIRKSILSTSKDKDILLKQHRVIYQALVEKNLEQGSQMIKEHFLLMKKNIF